ncbi:MAG: orotidine-5'-phosphate decarboxylase [Thermoplasmata archaeon]|nr:orotidine-5'-phosphate decarboxylase [Thermoplasmata archaeon]
MSRIILALDVTEREKGIKLAQKVAPYLHAIKVGWPLILSSSMGIVKKLSKIKPVICDFKVADIPNTTKLIVEQAKRYGAAGIIIHGFVGHDSIRAALEAAEDMKVYVVAEMSHPGAMDFMQAHTEKIVEMAKREGAHGLIAPATRPHRLRRIKEIAENMEILSPGVGAQGGKAKEAIEAGADYIIVGRGIYQSRDPVEAARKIDEEIRYARYRRQ